jgi:hypothetical protein
VSGRSWPPEFLDEPIRRHHLAACTGTASRARCLAAAPAAGRRRPALQRPRIRNCAATPTDWRSLHDSRFATSALSRPEVALKWQDTSWPQRSRPVIGPRRRPHPCHTSSAHQSGPGNRPSWSAQPTWRCGHPSGAGWSAWTPAPTPGRARPSPAHRKREVNPMSTLRRLPTRLLLVAGPAVLLVVETAGRYFP